MFLAIFFAKQILLCCFCVSFSDILLIQKYIDQKDTKIVYLT